MPPKVTISQIERVLPETPVSHNRTVALSLLDATTADFALTNAIWLLERPKIPDLDISRHLRQSLRTALTAYPQWCGQCKAILTTSDSAPPEAANLAPHARRFGRIYVHFGTASDPGVELVTATSTATLDDLYPVARTEKQPLWKIDGSLKAFSPGTAIAETLQPNEPDENGVRRPLLAIQITQLACGGFVLAAKSAHPMADISALVRLIKDWARVSRAELSGEPVPVLSPVFDPARVDDSAAGGIDAETPDPTILDRARRMPMHRFDWWAPGSAEGAPWSVSVPDVFRDGQELEPAGRAMPWVEWDVQAPVESYIVHLTREQVDFLWREAARMNESEKVRVSKHDAVLAHIWSSVVRARELDGDAGPVHCDLTIGLRLALRLGEDFIGSPVVIVNVEMSGAEVAGLRDSGEEKPTTGFLGPISKRIRETIVRGSDVEGLKAHLYGLAFEKAPQRIWQGFLGRRHILVTTWARSGIYEVDFGVGAGIRYADGIVPDLDGDVLIKEAPPTAGREKFGERPAWTDNGVDVSLHLRREDMERLLRDPLLLPRCI